MTAMGTLSARFAALRATGLLETPSDEAFDRFSRLVASLLGTPVALVSLVDVDRQRFVGQEGLGEPWATRRETPLSHSFCQHVVADGDLVVTDARADARLRANPAIDELGVVAYAGVPLEDGGHRLGAMCAIDHAPRAWTARELAILREVAALANHELGLRRVLTALRRDHQLVHAIVESIDDAVIATDASGELLVQNAASVRMLGPTARPDPGGAAPPAWGLFRSDQVTPLPVAEIPLVRALAGETIRHAEIVVRKPDSDEVRWHAVNASPVRAETGVLVGAVSVGRDVTELRAAQLALEQAAVRDALTGLYNRRGFLEQATLAVRRADRSQRPLAVVYVDLDGMKGINDQLGHAAGDQALRAVADVLAATFRTTDLVARVGGDELVGLAADYLPDDPAVIEARVREAIAARDAVGDLPFRLRASVGAITYRPADGARPLDALLAEADACMYVRKQAARAGRPPP